MAAILEKLEKLRAMAQSNSPHEAAIALRKLQEMLAEHNLTEKDLDRYKVGEITIKSTQSVSQVKDWENGIMWIVAEAFGGIVLYTNGSSWLHYSDGSKKRNPDPFGYFTIVGFKQTLPLMEYAATFLLRAVVDGRRRMNRDLPAKMDRRVKTYELDGYCQGFVAEVEKKVSKLVADPLIADYVKEKTEGRKARDAQERDGGAYGQMKGVADGKKIDLHRPMSQNNQLMIGAK
jgi:hypothetical protein